ncbi:unnamed protein product [Euphydryas editha]|uniref:Uncharacterized protein n=1 Tax=Euphydryas editha TaxID=104508 RepID=A0AAU9TJK5_EUPED|nr:unnamed protein product [Euphydryas editha]
MFARADNGACIHLHGIAPLHARPPEGRPLPRELLLSPHHNPSYDGDDGDVTMRWRTTQGNHRTKITTRTRHPRNPNGPNTSRITLRPTL